MNARKKSFENILEGIFFLVNRAFELAHGEREQVENRHPARQALRDFFHQQKILRTGQDDFPVAARLIHLDLNVGKQLMQVLRFVNDDTMLALLQKPEGIVAGELTGQRILQIGVFVFRENLFHQRRFPRLARAGDAHDGYFARDVRIFSPNCLFISMTCKFNIRCLICKNRKDCEKTRRLHKPKFWHDGGRRLQKCH